MNHHDEETDRILGITRCAECGHRLDGEEDCPFCAAMRGMGGGRAVRSGMPLWIYLTALLMTFPLSLPWLIKSPRLPALVKAVLAALGTAWVVVIGSWFV